MSIECMDRVFRYSKTTKPAERLVLLAIADHANADGTGAYPSLKTIANKCGVSTRYVTETIRSLEKIGELIVVTGGGKTSNHYIVNVWPIQQPEANDSAPVNHDTPMNYGSPVNHSSSLTHEPEFTPPMNHSSTDPSFNNNYTPNGVAAQPQPVAGQIREILNRLEKAKPNERQPILLEAYKFCFGENGDMPSYAYLGKAAKVVGGAGYLVDLMCSVMVRPPAGDKLAYLMETSKAKKAKAAYVNGKVAGNNDPAIWHQLQNQDVPDYMQEIANGN